MPTYATDIKPSSTGLRLGNENQKWIAYVSNIFVDTIQSATANSASTGFLRLASGDALAWRNAANTADVLLSKTIADSTTTPADTLVWGGSGIEGPILSHNLNPASAGELRLASTDVLNFRNNANTADINGLSHNVDDSVNVGGPGGVDILGPLAVAGNLSVTGSFTTQGQFSTPNFNNIVFIDGVQFPRTAAGINAAIASSAAGSIIFLGHGDITIDTTITIDRPTHLFGSGRSGRLVPSAVFAGPVVQIIRTANSLLNDFGQAIGAKVSNIWIEDTAWRSHACNGIYIAGHDQVTFDNVVVYGLNGYALALNSATSSNTPVRECSFNEFRCWWCGNPSLSLAALHIIDDPLPAGDTVNDIFFNGGKINFPMWEAIHIDTTKLSGPNMRGPGGIRFINFQIEGRELLNSTSGSLSVPVTADLVHIVQGDDFYFYNSIIVACGQGKACVKIDCTPSLPCALLVIDGTSIGAAITVSGTVNTSGVTVNAATVIIFNPDGSWNGLTISINSVNYTIASVTSTSTLTLTGTAGTQTGVNASIAAGGYGIQATNLSFARVLGVRWFLNPLGNATFQVASTALAANYNAGTAKTLFTPVFSGQWRINYSQAITQAATTSSTFPSLTLGWTDAGGIARTKTLVSTSATNTTAVESSGSAVIYTNSTTAITVTSAAYASVGATPMQYELSVTADQL